MSDTVLIRLRPYDPRRGCVLRQYTTHGLHFREAEGWYTIDRAVAEALRDEKQPPVGDTPPELVPPAFDVREQADAVALEAAEEKAKQERAKAASPRHIGPATGVLTTADLPSAHGAPPAAPVAGGAPAESEDRGSRRGVRRREG